MLIRRFSIAVAAAAVMISIYLTAPQELTCSAMPLFLKASRTP